jgi:hypothetical protein
MCILPRARTTTTVVPDSYSSWATFRTTCTSSWEVTSTLLNTTLTPQASRTIMHLIMTLTKHGSNSSPNTPYGRSTNPPTPTYHPTPSNRANHARHASTDFTSPTTKQTPHRSQHAPHPTPSPTPPPPPWGDNRVGAIPLTSHSSSPSTQPHNHQTRAYIASPHGFLRLVNTNASSGNYGRRTITPLAQTSSHSTRDSNALPKQPTNSSSKLTRTTRHTR